MFMTMHNVVSDSQLQALLDGAYDLLAHLPPNAHIIGIGNSPSWLLYTAELIAKENELTNLSFSNLPFSGKALHDLHGCWYSEADLSENQIIQDHFNHHKHTPTSLLEKDIPIVYVDYLESGNGGMSPITALAHQATQEGRWDILKSRLSIINIGPNIKHTPITTMMAKPFTDPYNPEDISDIMLKAGNHPDAFKIPCTNLSRDFYTEIGIDCSTNCPGSRLVESFYPPGTTGILPYAPPDLDFIRDMKKRISQAIRGRKEPTATFTVSEHTVAL